MEVTRDMMDWLSKLAIGAVAVVFFVYAVLTFANYASRSARGPIAPRQRRHADRAGLHGEKLCRAMARARAPTLLRRVPYARGIARAAACH